MSITTWPERAVAAIQRAVNEWPACFPDDEPLRVVWGAAEHEFEREMVEKFGKDMARADALMNWGEVDIDVILLPAKSPADACDELRLRVNFGDPLLLPNKTGKLYGVLRRCEGFGVVPGVYPHFDKPNRIAVMGIVCVMPVEAVSSRVLRDAIERMDSAAEEVFMWVNEGEGDNLWNRDASDEPATDE